MQRFKRILAVYHDDIGADNVFSHAVALARQNDARLTLLDVVPERYATPAGERERFKRLQRLLPAIQAEGVDDADVRVLSGTPFLEIIREVIREEHDIVITSPETSTGLSGLYLGSTTTHLVRKCPCPVWVVKPNQDGRYANILACIDPRSNDGSENQLDQKIVDLAASLATSNGASLHVVHAWDVEGRDLDSIRSEIADQVRRDILEKHKGLHSDRVRTVLEEGPIAKLSPQLHLPRGSQPHREILKLVETESIDLIVMGSVVKTGISGLLIGSEAESILAQIRCGLLSVKPDGFRTPVHRVHVPAGKNRKHERRSSLEGAL